MKLTLDGKARDACGAPMMWGLRLTINGEARELDVDPDMPLLWALRDVAKVKGPKYGCGRAQCGSCTVLVNGRPVRSCVRPVGQVEGAEVTTIEGLARGGAQDGTLSRVQRAWVEAQVPQCGYCQAGQIMSAHALLSEIANPSDADIDRAMAGNLCRCGTYPAIRAAIHRAAKMPADGETS